MKNGKTSLIRRDGFQTLLASLACILGGILVGYIALLIIEPSGALDAIADIAAFCHLLRRVAPDNVVASPIHVGSGTVKCAHGELPVPAPATAFLLEGVPAYSDGEIVGELCTPTGAALIRRFAASFSPQPLMTVRSVGYGAGRKEFPRANVVRAMLGDTASSFAKDKR